MTACGGYRRCQKCGQPLGWFVTFATWLCTDAECPQWNVPQDHKAPPKGTSVADRGAW